MTAVSESGTTNIPPKETNQNSNDDDPPPVTLARPFRSRKNRPCDGCRRAKTRCAITEVGTPCVECQHTRKKCTFDELPRERKKPSKRSLSPQELTIDTINPAPSKRSRTSSTNHVNVDPGPSTQQINDSDAVALEETRGYHIITAVLTDDLLPVGARKAGGERIEQTRQISLDGRNPQYAIFSRRSDKQRARPPDSYLDNVKSALSLLHPPPSQTALLDLYLSASNAAFPILPPPKHILASAQSSSSPYSPDYPYPLPILAKIYTAALNHAPRGMYRPSVKTVRVLTEGQEATGLPRSSLTNISDALLDISARPLSSAEDDYLILARALAQAQLLGLHIDPTNWGIPSWEKDFRRVLWWALRVHDSWASFLNSRPSHVQTNNHTVPLPSIATILSATQQLKPSHPVLGGSPGHLSNVSSPRSQHQHSPQGHPSSQRGSPFTPIRSVPSVPPHVHSAHSFLHLCRLTILVSRLQTQVCTLMAPKDERLGRVVDIEKEVESLLEEARDAQKEGAADAPGFPSLMTCLLGFRCMARRIAIELSIGLGSPFTPDPETLERYAQAVEYITALDGRAFDGFWLVYVGHILSSVTSSLIRLSLATTASLDSPAPSPSAQQHRLQVDSRTNPIFLLCRLRCALQKARDFHHWDLANAALKRAENVAACLQNLGEEFGNVVLALQGTLFNHHEEIFPQAMGGHSNGNVDAMIASDVRNWNIDLNAFGNDRDWSGFEGMPTVGPSPDYGFNSS
ncbi:hypothetical protein EDD18DRAFT_1353765 [Armillaria luteobubalina]|uniref:Zn(2)-C6 fungal-type domain-containing protein n=1 Tax=Armillaria luteobubalina TaxID=153913 RepID=A0AA39TNR8_9AGAR|nr:hypothetical protein EDD18DRAFT_1353765 [Armillaria luteobubalina]